MNNKNIILIISTIVFSININAGGNENKIDRGNSLDNNNYSRYSKNCREILNSGVIEIKNKNLDYDKNKIFFKHQRITYVIPDKGSKQLKRCIREFSTGINEVNMNKLIRKLD